MARGLLKEKLKAIITDIKDNYLSREDAILCAGLSMIEFDGYVQRSPNLLFELEKSEARRNKGLLKKIIVDGDDNAKWLLSRLEPSRFAKPSVSERSISPIFKDEPTVGKIMTRRKRIPKDYTDYDTSNEPDFFPDPEPEPKKQLRKLKKKGTKNERAVNTD